MISDSLLSQKNFNKPEEINTQNNIIAGPQTKPWKIQNIKQSMQYWNHSPGNKMPMEREEQPLPIQGNIGFLIKNEALNQYKKCSNDYPISGSPNCADAFYPDMFTPTDTCGNNCKMNAPESFGDKDFGFEQNSNKFTNAHGIHAYQNIRAGAAGQSSQSGCYEFIPNTSKSLHGTCTLNTRPSYQTVGDWTKLQEFGHLVSSSWNSFGEKYEPTVTPKPYPPTSHEPPSSSHEPPSSSYESPF
jgi:hypothetical protein